MLYNFQKYTLQIWDLDLSLIIFQFDYRYLNKNSNEKAEILDLELIPSKKILILLYKTQSFNIFLLNSITFKIIK